MRGGCKKRGRMLVERDEWTREAMPNALFLLLDHPLTREGREEGEASHKHTQWKPANLLTLKAFRGILRREESGHEEEGRPDGGLGDESERDGRRRQWTASPGREIDRPPPLMGAASRTPANNGQGSLSASSRRASSCHRLLLALHRTPIQDDSSFVR